MKNKILLFGTVIAAIVLISGCNGQTIGDSNTDFLQKSAISQCTETCNSALQAGKKLINGPCLQDPIPNTDWVCDIAHEPREAIDNLPENQCQSYRNGTAKHFVEVTENCRLIKFY